MYGRAHGLDRFAPKKRKRIARRAVELSTRGSESERCASNIVEFIVWENSIKKAGYPAYAGIDLCCSIESAVVLRLPRIRGDRPETPLLPAFSG